jgi:hypothetical protein
VGAAQLHSQALKTILGSISNPLGAGWPQLDRDHPTLLALRQADPIAPLPPVRVSAPSTAPPEPDPALGRTYIPRPTSYILHTNPWNNKPHPCIQQGGACPPWQAPPNLHPTAPSLILANLRFLLPLLHDHSENIRLRHHSYNLTRLNHRQSTDLMLQHQPRRILNRLIRPDGYNLLAHN